jgi:cobalt-zinc-cadmium efflux system protein
MHVHTHGHHAAPGQGRERSAERRGLLLAIVTTAVILVAEAVGGWLSNSLALLADAGHMLSDVLALILAYAALSFAERPATRTKTYGWYRLEILAALLNGVLLVVISLFIVWEAYERLLAPPVVDVQLMIVIAIIGLVANALGLYFLSGHNHSLNMRGAYLHILGDLLSSVGVVIGGVAMWATGAFWVDPLLSVLISFVIVVGAWRLLRESVDVLLEATPAGIDYHDVEDRIADLQGVVGVHDLHIWSLTSGINALSCHVEVEEELLPRCQEVLDAIRHIASREFGISHVTVQIEPEDYKRRQVVHWHLRGPSEDVG